MSHNTTDISDVHFGGAYVASIATDFWDIVHDIDREGNETMDDRTEELTWNWHSYNSRFAITTTHMIPNDSLVEAQ